jgi:peptidoglycan/xylan/chitin deacetylase (PgdA/CDA1 family)
VNKRNLCSQAAARLGLLRVLDSLAQRDCLLVLNYHRVGNSDSTEFDSGVFSATSEEFETQLAYLYKRYAIISLGEAVELACKWQDTRSTKILITFDDGYKDNYTNAFPVLRSLGVPAAFFLVSSYLDHPIVPWWDRIAYCVRHSSQSRLRLEYPESREFPLSPGRREDIIFKLLQIYKSPATNNAEKFLQEIEAACVVSPGMTSAADLFVNREEAREMIRAGMSIGSHTRSHRILSKLSRSEQCAELSESRAFLTRELGMEIDALAYPVGGLSSFTQTTRSLAAEAGYRAAFSFCGGLNLPGATDRFAIRRIAVDRDFPMSRFRLRTSLAVVSKGFCF